MNWLYELSTINSLKKNKCVTVYLQQNNNETENNYAFNYIKSNKFNILKI